MKTTFTVCFFLLSTLIWAQSGKKYAETITQDDLKKHLSILASDEYEGRETGMLGQKKAAEYIQNHFKSLELEGIVEGSGSPYFQEFVLEKAAYSTLVIKGKKGSNMELLKDFFSIQGLLTEKVKGEFVFAGYGLDEENYSDYKKGADVKGKIAVMIMGEPKDKDDNYIISGSDQKSSASSPQEKAAKALEKGAIGAIVLYDDDETLQGVLKSYASYFSAPKLGFPTEKGGEFIFLSSQKRVAPLFAKNQEAFDNAVEAIKEDAMKFKAYGISSKVKLMPKASIQEVTSENVLGFMEGTDLKDEVVVITAHYDHIGISENGDINNGADDDGSGTTGVLEIAEAFSKAKAAGNGPRRSILFMTVSGEEKGLLGSEYYSDNPIIPLEKTVTDLNIDMIGRVDPKHEDEENPNYIYIIGSNMLSDKLHALSERVAADYGEVELDYRYNDKDDPNRFYYRSDHYNFAKHNIPVIFYFNGTHEDYHKPTDEVDKIHFPKMEKVTRLIFLTAWEIANQDERITADKLEEGK
ncbi:MAG: M28 family peptidase [Bacteroidota bacterium]